MLGLALPSVEVLHPVPVKRAPQALVTSARSLTYEHWEGVVGLPPTLAPAGKTPIMTVAAAITQVTAERAHDRKLNLGRVVCMVHLLYCLGGAPRGLRTSTWQRP
jgi:hypothetical protein